MNVYDKAVLVCAVPTFVVLAGAGNRWAPVETAMIRVLSLMSIQLYHADLVRADTNFFLKYFLSSQSAILWMSALLVSSAKETVFYWISLLHALADGGAIRMMWVAVLDGVCRADGALSTSRI